MPSRWHIDGTGPAKIMVLPGWFGDEHILGPMLPALDLDAYRFAALAYRGYGAARDVAGAYTLDEIAADALAAADDLGWDQFAVIGHSMGGKAAQVLALLAPSRIRAIVALTPVPAQAVPFDAAGWSLFSGAAGDAGKRGAIINFSTGGRLTPVWAQGMAARSFARSTPAAFHAYLNAWSGTDISAAVAGSLLPLLVVIGAHDPQINAETMAATYLASYPNARLATIANAGHYPIDEAPIETATLIQDFLATVFKDHPDAR